MAMVHMPEPRDLVATLGTLTGKNVRVAVTGSPNAFADQCLTARYVMRDDRLAALVRVDFELGACLAGALAMMPPAGVEEVLESGTLDESLVEAYGEVANIMASLICEDGAPHMRLADVATIGEPLTDADKSILENPCRRVDVEVEIEAYGRGRLSLLSAAVD